MRCATLLACAACGSPNLPFVHLAAFRLIEFADNGARLDDAPITDAGLMLDAAALASPIKLSAGKKRHALVTLAM